MAGCGVNETNILQLFKASKIREFHFSARELFDSKMTYHNENIYMGAKDVNEFSLAYTTSQRVKTTIKALIDGV